MISGSIYFNYLGRPIFSLLDKNPIIYVKQDENRYLQVALVGGYVETLGEVDALSDDDKASVIVVDNKLFKLNQKYEDVEILKRMLLELKSNLSRTYYETYQGVSVPF